MLSHITLGTNDLDRAMAFYDKTLAPLGIKRTETLAEYGFAMYQSEGNSFGLFICRPQSPGPTAGRAA